LLKVQAHITAVSSTWQVNKQMLYPATVSTSGSLKKSGGGGGGGNPESRGKTFKLSGCDDDMELAERIYDVFHAYDRNGDDMITRDELSFILKKLDPNFDKETLTLVLEGADKNTDGKISLQEWINWICKVDTHTFAVKNTLLDDDVIEKSNQLDYEEREKKRQEAEEKRAQEAQKVEEEKRAFQEMKRQQYKSFEDRLTAAFACFDRDGESTIDVLKLKTVMWSMDPSWTKEELECLFAVADRNRNGFVDYSEFAHFISYTMSIHAQKEERKELKTNKEKTDSEDPDNDYDPGEYLGDPRP